jgi:hypothetical protein
MIFGIYGAYSQGNFGDDLMALMFAQEVLKSGNQPLIYGLSSADCSLPGCQTTQNFDEFLVKSKCFIYGGGGILTVNSFKASFQNLMRQEIFALISHANKNNKAIGVFSVGSKGFNKLMPVDYAQKLLSSASVATVRLVSDLSWPFLPSNSYSYPDCVLGLKHNLDMPMPKPKLINTFCRRRIAVNLSKQYGYFSLVIFWLLTFILPIDVIYVAAHSSRRGFGSDFQIPAKLIRYLPRFHNYRINNALSALSELASYDAIISHKLHVGIASMALGSTFFPNSRNLKVLAFFTELGILSTAWSGILGLFMTILKSTNYDFSLREKSLIDAAISESSHHFISVNHFIRDQAYSS